MMQRQKYQENKRVKNEEGEKCVNEDEEYSKLLNEREKETCKNERKQGKIFFSFINQQRGGRKFTCIKQQRRIQEDGLEKDERKKKTRKRKRDEIETSYCRQRSIQDDYDGRLQKQRHIQEDRRKDER